MSKVLSASVVVTLVVKWAGPLVALSETMATKFVERTREAEVKTNEVGMNVTPGHEIDTVTEEF